MSHETIYQSLFVQARGELRRELAAHLRSGRTARKPHGGIERRGKITGAVSIRGRPAEAGDRAVPGHWEGDLLLGDVGQGSVITLVERITRFVLLAPLPTTHTAINLRETLTPLIASLPAQIRKTLTWDQGKEMAQHDQIAIDAGIGIYFCDPDSPWQRDSNENTACYASIGQKAATYDTSPKLTAIKSPSASTRAPGKPSHGRLHAKPSPRYSVQQPLETAGACQAEAVV